MFKVKQKITKILVACLTALFAVVLAVGGIFAMPNTTVNAESRVVATFDLGANGSAAHKDGSTKQTTYSQTVDSYTLSLTDGTNMYPSSYDAKGNSCIKLGSSSKTGGFTFTVPDDIIEVFIHVGKYKTNATKITVNGATHTLTKNSNDGEYDEIVVDTSTTKTVTFSTASGGVRAMVNTITFGVAIDNAATEIVNAVNTVDSFMQLSYKYNTTTSTETVVTSAEATITFDDKAKRTAFSSTKQVWNENDITVTNDKAGSTNDIADYAKPVRFYANSTITVEYTGMTKIEFTCNTATHATALKNSIGDTATVSDKVVTVEFAEADEYIITLGGQVRMDSLTVYSAAGGETSEKEVTTYSDSTFVIKCGIDAAIKDIAGVEDFGIRVSAGGKTVDYNSTSANSWKLDETNNVYYVVINLGDIINDTTKLGTEFTVQAYVVYDGITYASELTKVHSVASMIKEYKDAGESVDHLYDYLVSKNLIVENEEEVA